uniref:Putative sulfate/thiosulfate import ATP-binding protein CysA n=1 Tax=Codium simulans TaxID=589376 RepID=A0A1I9LKD7_9CHLO|nr:putative sulfate/thiosulfate import ATP-binding protein CysA [Codium simulans]ANJ70798.1 putative sulfate/thiosulfate import ATP-binding protein CysA [Codium simulans]
MSILIENLVKKSNNQYILNHLNLEIQTGKLVTLLGPSGSGKSTLLRIIAGFEEADSGSIWLTGKKTTNLKIQERQIGFVFQDYALFPHLTIFENIAFGMRIRQIDPKIIHFRVQELLQLIELENKSEYYPYQLSGGQKQRIAFVRALAIEPKILLLDEPFGALDRQVRQNLRRWLCHFLNEIQVTTILVTHDQQEAFEISDEIIIFNNGQIQQIGLAQELIDYPYTSFVQSFILP